jgi:hypothetical protein
MLVRWWEKAFFLSFKKNKLLWICIKKKKLVISEAKNDFFRRMFSVIFFDDFILDFNWVCNEAIKIYSKVVNKLEEFLFKINSVKFNIF